MFKLKDVVELMTTGCAYSSGPAYMFSIIVKYIFHYKPINVKTEVSKYNNMVTSFNIYSGFGTVGDLSKRKDLVWKIRYVFKSYPTGKLMYIISSNQNHMLVVAEQALKLLD